ncbi:actin-like ATPase domain-containing protein [Bimuria novae-zelandiae CBS 107.79]|uniref:Phosphotransferase n=1 Tax=Bimuria novae-zelandiae CBS 107.79 TaxID=1447943 RepID=A0A6A5UKI5_9PLEO|nr:actin-like ATPase domain-containing protein [Bimuria novae-zelandiae CBS 107.79]
MATDHDEESLAIAAFTDCLNESTLLDLARRFSEVYRDLAKSSLEHFLVTPLTALPTGKEKGKFITIDVGGSNLRVGFVELLGEAGTEIQEDVENGASDSSKPFEKIRRSYDKSWPIEEHLKMDKAEDLFEWIGDCMAEVITDALNDMPASVEAPFGDELLLGITFSFPMAQKSLSEATLLPMGKGFAITSDLDLGKMLRAGYAHHIAESHAAGHDGETEERPSSKKRKLSRLPRIRIAAITNDTVATFASLAYAVKAAPNSRVAMGLIVGTGTNATVPMRLSELHPAKRDGLPNPDAVDNVVINTEWTIRGTDKPLIDLGIKTIWDKILDAHSEAPGFQPFEYMTSGRYLGEIVRLVFVDLVSKGTAIQLPTSLKSKNAIQTKFLSEHVANSDDDSLTNKLRENFPSSTEAFWTPARVASLRKIAGAVQQRSSALIAAACVGLLDCVHDVQIDPNARNGRAAHIDGSEPEELVIAYTGSTISQYPDWLRTCQRWIDALVAGGSTANASKRVVLREALDGGIIGAGVLASMTDSIA